MNSFLLKRARFILIMLFFPGISESALFPRVNYAPELNAFVISPVEMTRVHRGHFSVHFHDGASDLCPGNLRSSIDQKMRSLFSEGRSAFWNKLLRFDPGMMERFLRQPLYVSVDWFPFVRVFQSLHLVDAPEKGQSLISLDCRLFEGDPWKAHFAHELIHYSAARHDLPSWLEEMMAQLVEIDLSPVLFQKIGVLENHTQLPSPLSTRRPFATVQDYAMNLLLAKYLVHLYGENVVINAFSQYTAEGRFITERFQNCEAVSADMISHLLCSIRTQMNSNFHASAEWNIDSRESLLRHFFAALILSKSASSLQTRVFRIPGWSGFRASFADRLPDRLDEAEFVRLNPSLLTQAQRRLSARNEELFRILWNESHFLILMGDQIRNTQRWHQLFNQGYENDELILWKK